MEMTYGQTLMKMAIGVSMEINNTSRSFISDLAENLQEF
jgi:hypothetical protein